MNQPVSESTANGKSFFTSISVALILITILSLTFVGYTALNPHVTTVTQQQLVTNTQSLYSTQTVTSIGMITSVATITSILTAGNNYGYYSQNCENYGCYSSSPGYYFNGNYYSTCQPIGPSNTVRCSGSLYQDSNGCIELTMPVINWVNDPYNFVTTATQYYTLHNLPSSYPSIGSWVTVTGQLNQGYNVNPNGVACPGNYIYVTSIST